MDNKIWKPVLPPFRRYKKKIFSEVIKTSGLVYQIGESDQLRKPSNIVPVEDIKSEEFQKKIKYLKKVLLKYRKLTGKGRGVTAVQVGIQQRFSVIYMPARHARQVTGVAGGPQIKGNLMVIINPQITKKSTKLYRYPEICMSANPIIAQVSRSSWIEFEYYDENGKKKYWDKKDTDKDGKMYNRVFQHEIDHMDGIINIDKVDSKELILESDPHFYDNAKFEVVE